MFVVITCPRRILNLPPLILFGCQNLNIFGDPFFGNWNFFTQQWTFIHSKKLFPPSLKNFSHHKTSFSLKIFYTIKNFCVTNVQGLVTFSSVGKPFPDLNQTKISELQTHIFETSPDVVIYNETWLKPTIKSSEILSPDIYTKFSD